MKMVKMANMKATEVKVPEDPGSNPAVGPSPPPFREERETQKTQIT